MPSRIPLGRFGEADEVAYVVLYLASNESAFVTGSELVIDGGWTAQERQYRGLALPRASLVGDESDGPSASIFF